jgi:hypothetical protein
LKKNLTPRRKGTKEEKSPVFAPSLAKASLPFFFRHAILPRVTVTQTVEIPADHRITLEVPSEVPPGRTILAFTPVPDRGGAVREVESSPKGAKKRATPHSDALFAIFSQIGSDIDPDEIRSERLAKHLR